MVMVKMRNLVLGRQRECIPLVLVLVGVGILSRMTLSLTLQPWSTTLMFSRILSLLICV